MTRRGPRLDEIDMAKSSSIFSQFKLFSLLIILAAPSCKQSEDEPNSSEDSATTEREAEAERRELEKKELLGDSSVREVKEMLTKINSDFGHFQKLLEKIEGIVDKNMIKADLQSYSLGLRKDRSPYDAYGKNWDKFKEIKEMHQDFLIKLDAAGYSKVGEVRDAVQMWQTAYEKLTESMSKTERTSIVVEMLDERGALADPDMEIYLDKKLTRCEAMRSQAKQSTTGVVSASKTIKTLAEEVESYR